MKSEASCSKKSDQSLNTLSDRSDFFLQLAYEFSSVRYILETIEVS